MAVGWRRSRVSTQTDGMADPGVDGSQVSGPVLPGELAERLVAQARAAGVSLTEADVSPDEAPATVSVR
jgi:hypothetical protein